VENLKIYQRLQRVKPSPDMAASRLSKEWSDTQRYKRNCSKFRAPPTDSKQQPTSHRTETHAVPHASTAGLPTGAHAAGAVTGSGDCGTAVVAVPTTITPGPPNSVQQGFVRAGAR
jgi:hypothetical protein